MAISMNLQEEANAPKHVTDSRKKLCSITIFIKLTRINSIVSQASLTIV